MQSYIFLIKTEESFYNSNLKRDIRDICETRFLLSLYEFEKKKFQKKINDLLYYETIF